MSTGAADAELNSGERSVDTWVEGWKVGRIGFHKDDYHELFVKYIDKMINGRSDIKIFFPLCGKSLDMKWMYNEGHVVVGVECASQALEEFYKENNLDYIIERVDTINATLYKSTDGRIRLYCCDFFTFSTAVENGMQGVWDRGSLVAINRQDRQRYVDLLMSLMAPDCRYLLSALEYDASLYAGPPHTVFEEDVESLFGSKCKIENIDVQDAMTDRQIEWGLDRFDEKLHLITLK